MKLSGYPQNRSRIIQIFCIVTMLAVVLAHAQAQAHKVNVFAYVEGDSVVVEGYFGGNVKAQDSAVEVYDESGKKIHEGKTDKKGTYAFKLADLPAFSGSLKIVLEAGMGHRAEYTLSASDIPGGASKKEPSQEEPQTTDSEPQPDASLAARPSTVPVVDQAALTAALETLLDKKLSSITRMLGKQEKLLLEEKYGGPRMTDIIGGIGWIVGMVGIAAFFWGRNRSDGKE